MTTDLIALIDANFKAALGKPAELYGSAKKGAQPLSKLTHGKLFEILALSKLLTQLKRLMPHCKFDLMDENVKGNRLVLQSAPGFAHPGRSYIRVRHRGMIIATVWMNVEFEGLSGNKTGAIKSGSYHEADILVLGKVNLTTSFRPSYEDVLLVIECKSLTVLPKSVLRGLLGLRREMGLLNKQQPSALSALDGVDPTSHVELKSRMGLSPASHLIFFYPNHYDFDPKKEWDAPAERFGLEFWPH